MRRNHRFRRLLPVAGALLLAASRTAAAAPGGAAAVTPGAPAGLEAEIRFLRDMIEHHRQALELTALVPERAASGDVRRLARRIEISQADEIRMMEAWLARREAALPVGERHGQPPHPGHHAHTAAHDPAHDAAHDMPGMLTPAQLERLAAARGAEFDRVFLESMIFHHEGALAMVAELLEQPGAAAEPELFMFAAHVDADQYAEIARMRSMLAEAR
jgi:uncharacterized protein (DUF305 family)